MTEAQVFTRYVCSGCDLDDGVGEREVARHDVERHGTRLVHYISPWGYTCRGDLRCESVSEDLARWEHLVGERL